MPIERAEQIVVRGFGEMLRRILEQSSVDLSPATQSATAVEPQSVPPSVSTEPADDGLASHVRPARQATTQAHKSSESLVGESLVGEMIWHRALRAPSSFDEETRRVTAWLAARLAAQ